MAAEEKTAVNPETWVEQYGDYLYRFALLRLRDPASAEDAVQETFLAALKGLDRYDGRVDIKYWLRGILRNKIVDRIRQVVREQPTEDEELAGIQNRFVFKAFGIPTARPAPWQFDVNRAFERAEFWTVFEKCMGRLKGLTQRAFALKMLDDVPSEEVCKLLNIKPNHLWVLLHRARAQLKQCLEQNWDVR